MGQFNYDFYNAIIMVNQLVRKDNSNNNGGGGRNAITPGVPSAQAAYPTNQPILIPAARGKVAQATLEEAEALDNDEPLLFN